MEIQKHLIVSGQLRGDIKYHASQYREEFTPDEVADYVEGLLKDAFKLGQENA